MTHKHKQSGFVSILTVLFFTTLISVATLSFARAMVLERQQQLEDELTKSAYNAALTGVEDAKRAMAYCATQTGGDRTSCEASLGQQTCPGFNTSNRFAADLGIRQSANGRTSTTGEPAATAAQGYSCVIVTRNTQSIEGTLDHTSGVTDIYEIRTTNASQPYQMIRIFWGDPADVVTADPVTNPQAINNNWGTRPAILRIGFVNAGDSLAPDSQLYTWFAVPVASGGITNNQITLTPLTLSRANVNCNATATNEGYRCYVDIAVSGWRHNYIALNSLYRRSNYMVVACGDASCTSANRRTFDNVQPTIDSTGYTSGVARRVRVNVAVGGQSVANAIDTAYGLCKDFQVGVALNNFADNITSTPGTCRP